MSSSPSRRRRKSSFFGVYKLMINDNEAMDETKLNHCSSDVVPCTELDREEIIRNRIAEMKNEIFEWKKVYDAIKVGYMEAKNHENGVILDWTLCKNCLNEEDIIFLTAKPKYEEIPSSINQLTERIEILKCKKNKTDISVGNGLQTACRNVHKIKEELCHLLLNCEESVSFTVLNDSGNCSMESIKLDRPL